MEGINEMKRKTVLFLNAVNIIAKGDTIRMRNCKFRIAEAKGDTIRMRNYKFRIAEI